MLRFTRRLHNCNFSLKRGRKIPAAPAALAAPAVAIEASGSSTQSPIVSSLMNKVKENCRCRYFHDSARIRGSRRSISNVSSISSISSISSNIRNISSRNTNQLHSYSNSNAYSNAYSYSFSTTARNERQNEGLFSLPNLHNPNDFLVLATSAIAKCNDLRHQIRTQNQSQNQESCSSSSSSSYYSPRDTLYTLDEISNTICSVIDASELCRSVHSCPKWRSSANDAFHILSSYIADLNTDEELYNSLLPITSDDHVMNTVLNEEERRMAVLLQAEFERDGIHLPQSERDAVREIGGHVTQLETMFSSNLLQDKVYMLEEEGLVEDLLGVIPRHVLESAFGASNGGQEYTSAFRNNNADDHSNSSSKTKPIRLSTEAHITNTILRHSPSPNLRRKVYMESVTSCPENLDVLDALIHRRHELATVMGYKSYAHYFTRDKMAQCPDNVREFLKGVDLACGGSFKADMGMLATAKKHVEGSGSSSTSGDVILQPWDLNFYNGLVKAHLSNDDDDDDNNDENNDGTVNTSSLAGYFTVEQSLEGMKILVQRLFGIAMQEVQTRPGGEQWDIPTNNNSTDNGGASSSSNSSLIRKYEFYKEEDGSALGTIYFDLHPREGKYGHAAHFTVQCGCELRNQSSSSSSAEYQLPIVALVCNVSPPFAHAGSTTDTGTALLSHSEVETLYHEFGHAIHSLLSRTKFQHLSGTRAAMDFVETPSHLMEYFVWNEEFLNIIARHYITGERIPPKQIQNLIKSRNVFKAIEVKTQCVYATFDQIIFGSPEAWRGVDGTITTTDVFASLHRENNIPYVDGTHWHSRFGHLVTYGAGYYSYLYASIFSADLWNTCFAGGTKAFDSDVGMSYWNNILIHGGSKDPNLMLRNMLGRDPKAEGFFNFS